MVTLSILLLVGFRMQIEKLRTQVEEFGLDNVIIIETLTPQDIANGVPAERFRSIGRWGKLFTMKRLLASARGSEGSSAVVMAYSDHDLMGLAPYLRYGHEVFVLSNALPEGLVVDYDIEKHSYTGVALKPDEQVAQLLQGDTLCIPLSSAVELIARGYSMIYYLERDQSAPSIDDLIEAVNQLIKLDGGGKIDIRSAQILKKKLASLESQQSKMRYWLAIILGAALALIYGVLSILEFRQSMYVSALLKSFGVSSILLGIRAVFENLLIVNAVTFGVIAILMRVHEKVFSFLKVKTSIDVHALYWSTETFWVIMAANAGVILSAIPVFLALRKQVGSILN